MLLRISFGGVLVAIGVLYLWLAMFPLRLRESWAWWALTLSGLAGFLSVLAYLGYGYLDTWHGVATLVLLPIFVTGLICTRGLRRERVEHVPLDLRSGPGIGRGLLLLSSVGISAGGLTIMTVGMTSVFVPEDLVFMGTHRLDSSTRSFGDERVSAPEMGGGAMRKHAYPDSVILRPTRNSRPAGRPTPADCPSA